MLPKDPVMLLSFVNTQLRDNYKTPNDLAAAYNEDRKNIDEKLSTIGYEYNEELNQYK